MLFKIFTKQLRKFIDSIKLNPFSQPYWVEITTKQPKCIYYFGPFESHAEAKKMQHGYIEDLIEEKATGIKVEIKRCMPTSLTIEDEQDK